MTNQFVYGELQLRLDRYPPEQKNRSLQAWDAADELLIKAANQYFSENSGSLLLVNDQFGALACALHQYSPVQLSDSLLSQLATQHNLNNNQLAAVPQLNSMATYPTADLVLIKLPANHSYLRYQLRQLKQSLKPGVTILAAAKAKDIHANLLAIFQQEIGPTQASLTEKKCRLITASFDTAQPTPTQPEFPIRWTVDGLAADPTQTFEIINHANVFAREQLDLGARFLITQLPECEPGQRVLDLGCGNGVLSLALLLKQPELQLVCCDESYMAVASARQTIGLNLPQQLAQCEFVVDDCLSQQADLSADYIICNPPFHQQNAVTDHIAWQMFADARRVLKINGRMRIVCNSHLGYHEKLARLFGGCTHIASNQKFTILEAIRRK